jgi:hypothetical protein
LSHVTLQIKSYEGRWARLYPRQPGMKTDKIATTCQENSQIS